MKKLLLVFLSALLLLPAQARSVEGRFTQTKTLPGSGRQIHSEGTLTYTSPDQLALLYSQPEGDYLIIDGPLVRTMNKGNEVNLDTSRNPQAARLRATLLNCLSGAFQAVADDNDATLTLTEKNGEKTAVIQARKAAPRGYAKVTVVLRKDGAPRSLVLEEFSGVTTAYELSDIVVR